MYSYYLSLKKLASINLFKTKTKVTKNHEDFIFEFIKNYKVVELLESLVK